MVKRPAARGLGSVEQYIREIGAQPLLSRPEEAELARRIRAGDEEARERLVTANLRFVVSVAKRYADRGVALADLINEGNLGLLRAAKRFDESRDVRDERSHRARVHAGSLAPDERADDPVCCEAHAVGQREHVPERKRRPAPGVRLPSHDGERRHALEREDEEDEQRGDGG